MTILALDHLIFGSGHGMRSPFWDNRFYWLGGELYTFSAGLGAQLHSVQWTHPKPGERRKICGQEFRPFSSYRRWGRVMVSWAWMGQPKDMGEAQIAIRALGQALGNPDAFYWPPAKAMSARQSQDRNGLGPKDASAVVADDLPNTPDLSTPLSSGSIER
ncbi:hypothetical protein [Sphingopyxis witflariensis]|uniref:Uncharacterized protein n=1 Tax=Sphingopyxis witflariensis TaxID=173675 RepID=A0A246JY23_9SPHN|nr:hypothetical protein [Sphingopyxis witflariensis]OWQ97988.1 hypothetical protein CDQ91_10230 [Sphingopyxis witflariensis]